MTPAPPAPVSAALAGPGRRLGGFVLDVVLFCITLGIGWLIWFLIVANRGQSPAKLLLNMRVVREDGSAAGMGRMLIRALAVHVVAFIVVLALMISAAIAPPAVMFALSALSALPPLVFIVAALWCVWDSKRQCLWDKIVRTRVVHAQAGVAAAPGVAEAHAQAGVAAAHAQAGVAAAGGSGASEHEAAENLRTLAELRDRGLLTPEEYEERRAREVERL